MNVRFPISWFQSKTADQWKARLCAAPRSVLLLDYDGTLAPFKNDRLAAMPYPDVVERLVMLTHFPNVRLAVISGREARQVQQFLESPSGERFEIWGSHGWERLLPDGTCRSLKLSAAGQAALDRVTEQVRLEAGRLGLSKAIERKPTSLAIHWRGLEPAQAAHLQALAASAAEPFHLATASSPLELVAFDGGLELRSMKHTKGTAVDQILAEEQPGLPAAYLGDDRTDEDAFRALGDRGLSILVRNAPRESLAPYWLKPPGELLDFLDLWIAGARRQGTGGVCAHAHAEGRS